MILGSCLCGSVVFEIDPEGVVLTTQCYCENCRKVSGSQYGVYLQVKPKHFRWLAGDDMVGTHESSPGNKRAFCRDCGCPAPIETNYGAVRVPGGALDADPGTKPDTILFTGSKAGWCANEAPANSFADAGPQEFWRTALARLFTP
jgi:hypothetical protein